jgi:ATP-binding cassette subfamily C exporter for protease/lipase
MKQPLKQSELRAALVDLYPYLKRLLLFSFFTSLLALAPSGYMFQVYDRVVNSRNHKTLLMLTFLVLGLYVMLEMLEWVRIQMMHDAGLKFDKRLRVRTFNAIFAARLHNMPVGSASQAMGDMKSIRDFLSSKSFIAFIDAPLALLVLVLIFSMHPYLGWFAVAGAVAQFAIGVVNERRIREPLAAAGRSSMGAQGFAGGALRNAQVIESMGMLNAVRKRWLLRQQEFLYHQANASDSAGANSSLSKLVQSLGSSLLLGAGCWLTLKGELHGSGMIIASILGGRVLSPLVVIIGSWRQVEEVRDAWFRLDHLLHSFPAAEKSMSLPVPAGVLSVDGVVAGPPESRLPILRNIGFTVAPGDSVAVIGPSASGKTTLARVLVGIWPAISGKVRLDGSDIYTWDKEELGPYIGYLPQFVELFDGSIAENVARFGDPDMEKVRAACRMVGLDALIESFPATYDTQIGDDGAFLSGGQRQRIALARAIYGMPKFVVLDEPNSNLDEAGDAALLETLRQLRARKTTVIVMTHRMNILAAVEYIMLLVDGQIRLFGQRDEVLSTLQPQPSHSQNGASLEPAAGGAPA